MGPAKPERSPRPAGFSPAGLASPPWNFPSMSDSTAGPREVVALAEHELTLLGTAHVSQASADEVRALIDSGEFDAVAIELCTSRHQSLTQPDAMAKLDLFQVLKQGKAGMVAASLALGAFQQRVAAHSGIEPGAEMRAAVKGAQRAGLPLYLIDREIGVTLKRIYQNVPWYKRFGLISGLLGSVLSRQTVSSEEIEKLKEGDVLESTFAEFAEQSESLYVPLIAERDRFMALKLVESLPDGAARRVLVVIGAGHLKGMSEHLRALDAQPPAAPAVRDERAALESTAPRARWWKALPWVIVALVLTGFAIGFSRDTAFGWSLVAEWVLINGSFSALGALIAIDASGKDIKMVSVDGHPEAIAAIRKPDSAFIATAAQYPRDMVRLGLGLGLAKHWGASTAPAEIPIDVTLIDRDNAADFRW